MEDLYCMYHNITTYLQTLQIYSQEGINFVFYITSPILSVSHMSPVLIVGVGKECRTKVGQSSFLNRLLELF